MNANVDPCLDAETLAAFSEGKLIRRDLQPVLEHIDRCPSCFKALQRANETVARETTRGFKRSWLAAAAVIVIAIAALPFLKDIGAGDGLTRLVALAPRDARTVEVRLSGGFSWAPYRGPMRAEEMSKNAQRLKLAGAAGDAVEKADREHSANSQHAAGIALVLIEQPLEAMTRLRESTAHAPNDAKAWSDLAAAEYAAALQLARPSLYPEALAAADRALRIDPLLPEALFNRGLLLERLGLRRQAYDAWQSYLRVDPGSPWASEARERAARLMPATGEQLFKQQLPRIERAVASHDQRSLTEIVDRYREQSRAFAEAEYLGRWAEAERSDDAANAGRFLAVARAIGDALVRLSGESLAREAVRAIDESDASRRGIIAAAHVCYRRGRIAYSHHEPLAAEPDLRQAATLFASTGDPMSIMARYYAAQARFDRNEVVVARQELQSLRAVLSAEPRFASAGALVNWELALCLMEDDDWTGALGLVHEAQATFLRLGERSNLGFVETLLADNLICLDRADEAWAARIRSFDLLSSEGRGDRLPVALGGTARMELRAGRLEAARAMLQLEEAAVREANASVLLANALVREAALSVALGAEDDAIRLAREGSALARSITDISLRERAVIDADFAEGSALLRSDPNRARIALTRAIEGYRAHDMAFFLPEPYLLRARANLANGLPDAAARDLESGIGALESHRINFASGVVGTGVFDAGAALFHDAVALSLDRGDIARAFTYAERSRRQIGTAVPIPIAELQQRLHGTDTAVLELVVLPAEVVAFTLTSNDLSVARQPLGSELADPETASDRALYNALIAPSERAFRQARQLIIVPDPRLKDIAFAALLDGAGRHLVERLPVAIGASASSLARDDRRPQRDSIVAVALPSGAAHQMAALPEIEAELAEVASMYRKPAMIGGDQANFSDVAVLASHADVLHIAGHSGRQSGDGEAVLIFAGERVSWRVIAEKRLPRRAVVVLSACETLRAFPAGSFPLSVGDGFIAAGAGDVIGTLTPVSDSDAREIFRRIHQQLAAGVSAAEAVRRVQLEGISNETTQHRRTAWRSIELLTSRITRAAGEERSWI